MPIAQRKRQPIRHRRGRAVVRLEVQVPARDAAMVRNLAAILRSDTTAAEAARDRLRSTIAPQPATTVFDLFGSDLPDTCFERVFDASHRHDLPRDAEI